MGNLATHAVVYAQLYMPDGTYCGLHSFVVPIRDPHTHIAYPGVIVGDMGEKLGQNGISHGYHKDSVVYVAIPVVYSSYNYQCEG